MDMVKHWQPDLLLIDLSPTYSTPLEIIKLWGPCQNPPAGRINTIEFRTNCPLSVLEAGAKGLLDKTAEKEEVVAAINLVVLRLPLFLAWINNGKHGGYAVKKIQWRAQTCIISLCLLLAKRDHWDWICEEKQAWNIRCTQHWSKNEPLNGRVSWKKMNVKMICRCSHLCNENMLSWMYNMECPFLIKPIPGAPFRRPDSCCPPIPRSANQQAESWVRR